MPATVAATAAALPAQPDAAARGPCPLPSKGSRFPRHYLPDPVGCV